MFVVGLFIVPSAEFYFFSSDSLNCAASSIVRVRYYANQIVLNTLWNSYLKQATKNVYRYLYFPKFPIPKEIQWWKSSKQKTNPFITSVTSTLPSPFNLRLGPGLGSNIIVCVVLFGCWFVGSGSTLVCPGFCQFGNILMQQLYCSMLYKASAKHMSIKGVLPRS